ncbi:MAG: GerAB/ArcD/ProY family transporter [Bacillota bacterium]|nr:GerAB/ArcD/ProY family transporter [Bacillota bacterium]
MTAGRGAVKAAAGRPLPAGRPRPQISATEGIALGTCLAWPTAVLYLPSVVASEGRENGWLGVLLGGLVVVPLALLLGALAGRLPHRGLVDQAGIALGRWMGKVVGGLFVLGTGVLTVYALRAGVEMVGLVMLPRTPAWVLALIMVLQGAVGAWYGLEVMARAAVLAFLSVGVVLVLLLPGFIPMFDARRLFPVLADGPGPLLRSAGVSAGFWGQVILLAMSAEGFYAPPHLRAATLGAGATSLLAGWLLVVLAQGAAGWYGVSCYAMPAIEVVRSVRVFLPLLERVDVLVVIGWTAMGFVQVAWLLWACARGVARVLGLVDSRPLVGPLAAVLCALSLTDLEDLPRLILEWTRTVVPIVTAGLAGLVALVWLVSVLRDLGVRGAGR